MLIDLCKLGLETMESYVDLVPFSDETSLSPLITLEFF